MIFKKAVKAQVDFIKVKWNLVSHVQLFASPWTIHSMEFSRPEYWCGEPFTSPGDLPNPEIEARSPVLKMDNLPAEPPGKKNIGKQDLHGPDCSFLMPKFRRKTRVVFLISLVKLDFIVLIKSITTTERGKKKKKRKKIQKKLQNKSKYKNSICFSWVPAVSVLSLARLPRMPSNTVLVSGPAVGAAQTLIWSYTCVFLPPMSIAIRTRAFSFVGARNVLLYIPQTQSLPSCSSGFNLQLV